MRGSLGADWPRLLPLHGGRRLALVAVVVGAHDGATEAAWRDM
jgi:hypothetical protein